MFDNGCGVVVHSLCTVFCVCVFVVIGVIFGHGEDSLLTGVLFVLNYVLLTLLFLSFERVMKSDV